MSGLCEAADDGVAAILSQTVEVGGLVVVLALRVMETGAAEEIEPGCAELFADLIVVAAFLHVGVEGRRRCMVDSDGSHDADAPSLGFEFLGDGRQAVAVGIETEGAVVGF